MMFAWLHGHDAVLWWMGALSVVAFVGTLIALPILVARIPADYFRRDRGHASRHQAQSSVLRVLGVLLKNLLGVVLILAGVAMLVLPGQGILTILIGLMLMNFPGKHALERRLVQQPSVLRAINWMRARAHQPDLQAPQSDATTTDNGKNP
jgi:hypothetical protein